MAKKKTKVTGFGEGAKFDCNVVARELMQSKTNRSWAPQILTTLLYQQIRRLRTSASLKRRNFDRFENSVRW